MKIILKEDVDTVGLAGEIVEVKAGYVRNYLIPKKLAVSATPANLKQYEEEKRLEKLQSEKEMRSAENLARQLEKVSVTAAVPVGEEDKIFGSVTSQNISDLLKEQDFDIDRRKIMLDEPLRALGVYDVPIRLHTDVEVKIKVWVVKE
jgi:large subunit ribosomal protein L9